MKLTPQQQTYADTIRVVRMFNKFTIKQLDFLLRQAGVAISCPNGGVKQPKRNKVAVAVNVWFHGSVPNFMALARYREFGFRY